MYSQSQNITFFTSLFRSEFKNMKSRYTIRLNTIEGLNTAKVTMNKENLADGPIAERICKKCGHNEMSYAAMQLRSADEGQTVFYTCVKCKYVMYKLNFFLLSFWKSTNCTNECYRFTESENS